MVSEKINVDYPEDLIEELKKPDEEILKEIKRNHAELEKRARNTVSEMNKKGEFGLNKEIVMQSLANKLGMQKVGDYYVFEVGFNFVPKKFKDIIDAEKNKGNTIDGKN